MKHIFRFAIALALLTVLQLNFLQKTEACGPSYLEPVFDYSYAPERPWTDFAGGKLGIVKPTYRRVVLFAAYRYLNGSGFGQDEQKALVETWEAQFNRKEPASNDVTSAVKEWVEARKPVMGEEEKKPDIYTERQNEGGYDFFPNCSKNAFEVAKKTLDDRAAAYGSDSRDVRNWIQAQDQVFANCVGGGGVVDSVAAEAPAWLQKDRDYQIAAAAFYSLKYDDAQERFEKIASDNDSPWRELADYLVARTLVRRGSLAEDDSGAKKYNLQAEEYLNQLIGRTSTYQNDARRLLNLVKYRVHPEERVHELAQKLPFQNDSAELRQDLIDYTWLLDEFESVALKNADEEKAAKEANTNLANANSNRLEPIENLVPRVQDAMDKMGVPVTVTVVNGMVTLTGRIPQNMTPEVMRAAIDAVGRPVRSQLEYLPDTNSSAPLAAATPEIPNPSSDSNSTLLPQGVSTPDANRSMVNVANAAMNASPGYNPPNNYNGSYYGNEELSLAVLPEFLGQDPLTEWVFTFQAQSDDAYFHSFDRWKQTSSEMWLMTAISKARRNLGGLKELMDATREANPESPAYPTIVYHRIRLLMDQGQNEEARKLLGKVLDGGGDLPVSTRNLFTAQRMKLSQDLGEFLTFSLRRPFGFAYDYDTAQSFDEIIAERKSWYSPEYSEQPQAQYDLEIEKEFAEKRLWQDRSFFDSKAVDVINQHFATAQMLEILNNPAFPDYFKRRLTIAIWTRAYLLGDEKTALAMAPAVVRIKPEIEPLMTEYVSAKTPPERDMAGLYMLLKTGELTPYLQSGFDYEDGAEDDFWQDDRWWCEQSEYDYDNEGNQVEKAAFVPPFLTKQMLATAKTQNSALKRTTDGVSYLSGRVLNWTKTGVPDRRLAESLYIVFHANRWIKYSCGNYSEETRNKAADILKKRYPRSKWTQKMFDDLKENEN